LRRGNAQKQAIPPLTERDKTHDPPRHLDLRLQRLLRPLLRIEPALHEFAEDNADRIRLRVPSGGLLAMAGYGPCASSKFAPEAVSDALRNELAPNGLQVPVVEPCGVKTELSVHGERGYQDASV
jgi:NAD(P)-dependent dehydrogenase (short-subunit alcohol dehydrogenase family)